MKIVRDIENMFYLVDDADCIIEFVYRENSDKMYQRVTIGVFLSIEEVFEKLELSKGERVFTHMPPILNVEIILIGETFAELGESYPEYFI